QPCRLAADPNLDEHEVRPVDRAIEIGRERELAAPARALEHPRREPADDVETLVVDVHERQLVDRDVEAPEAGHELRRVRRARADDGDLHPFTPVRVTPSTNAFCARKKMITTGTITSSVAAIVRFHCTWCSERNWDRPIDSTQWFGASPV